jgi:putative peptidoglycan binding protein
VLRAVNRPQRETACPTTQADNHTANFKFCDSSQGNAIGSESVLKRRSATSPTWGIWEMTMIRKLLIGTASVLVWGMGGAALDSSTDTNGIAHAAPLSSHHWIDAANLSKDDYRWAQVELHTIGLYNGSLDGVPGRETRRALLEFQESNGFKPTGKLDQKTADALTDGGVGQVSSTLPMGQPNR